jgi:hypothetical protein
MVGVVGDIRLTRLAEEPGVQLFGCTMIQAGPSTARECPRKSSGRRGQHGRRSTDRLRCNKGRGVVHRGG